MADFEIIDAHIHPFIEPVNNFKFFDKPDTTEELVAQLRKDGVNLCCGSVIGREWQTRFDSVAAMNRDALKFRDMYPGFFIPGISVHASFPEQSCAEIEHYLEHENLCWIGEIVPYMAGTTDYRVKTLFPVYDLAQEKGLPINLHLNSVAEIAGILDNFPRLKLVIAHPGERETYFPKLDLMEKYPNLYQDLSGTGLFRWGMLRAGVKRVGAERFIFGTDFPICNIAMNIAGVLAEGLSDRENELIFSGNFRRLTGVK